MYEDIIKHLKVSSKLYILSFLISFKSSSRHNPIFKDVYREVGILEVFVTCLNRYCAFLEKHFAIGTFEEQDKLLENGKKL